MGGLKELLRKWVALEVELPNLSLLASRVAVLAMASNVVVNSVNGKFTRHGELIYLGGELWQVLFLACFLNAVFTNVCMHYDS